MPGVTQNRSPTGKRQETENSKIGVCAHQFTAAGAGPEVLGVGWLAAGAGAAAGEAAVLSGFVKNVTTVQVPLTEVPGRIGYFPPFTGSTAPSVKSWTLMMRDSRLKREKKSTTLK